MGLLLNEQQFIEDNARMVEGTMTSPLNRYTDKHTTFTTYYHINPEASTINSGFENVERVIGTNSPLRFNKINNLPLLDIESIVLNLIDDDQGLDNEYEGDCLMLPNVLEPYHNDMFLITHTGKEFLFTVTGMEYDTVKAHNYYKITFSLKSIDGLDSLEKQVVETYNCIYDNIGSDEKCIIRTTDYELIKRIDTLYTRITEAYKMNFYDKKFNSFIFSQDGIFTIYDSYLNNFITENKLFIKKNDLSVLITVNEDYDENFGLLYEKSFYKALVRKKMIWYANRYSTIQPIKDIASMFNYHGKKDIVGVRLSPNGTNGYIDESLVYYLDHYSTLTEEDLANLAKESPLYRLIVRFFFDTTVTLQNFGFNEILEADYDFIEPNNRTQYMMLPVMLYIIRVLYTTAMKADNL